MQIGITNILSTWQIFAAFEIILFSSYTILMYLYSRKNEKISKKGSLPTVSLIIPMYNEEKVIKEKVKNTAKLDYPTDLLKIILLDDYSTDGSHSISSEAIEQTTLNATVLKNLGGKGKARALNWIFPSLESEITIISDADALLKEDSLLQLIKNFTDPDIGGATGKIIILSDKARASQSQEESYRFFFDIWRLGESRMQSVSICNGPLMGFKTDLLQKITIDPDVYADDSDILFKVIRSGYRVVYEPKAVVYERVPLSVKGRIVQKMKRINGLRTVYIKNLDLIGKGRFGKVIFPYALMTHIISPLVVLLMTILYPVVVIQNAAYLGLLVFFILPKLGETARSFVITQLIMNFSFLVPTAGSWESVEDARYNINHDI